MAVQPTIDAASGSAAKSNEEYHGFYMKGVPSHVSFINRLVQEFPTLTEYSVNKALHLHVEEVREKMSRDSNYAELAPYYDVVQSEDDPEILDAGFFDVPARLHAKINAVEYGDADSPPAGMLRKSVLSGVKEVEDNINRQMNWALGELIASG